MSSLRAFAITSFAAAMMIAAGLISNHPLVVDCQPGEYSTRCSIN